MKKLFSLLAIFPLLVSCNKNIDGPDEPLPLDLKDGSELVIESMNEFGLDIFSLIVDDEPSDKNVFISPASISLALAMTLNGANNATEDSMAFALRMNDLTPLQINETYRDLIKGLTTCDEKVLLEIANSIWYRQGFAVEQDFLDINEEYYNAEVAALDFSSPDALETINGWVADRTHDKIPEIINSIDPSHVMFLINAIYFKGIWTLEFDEESTYDGNFQLANSGSKEVRMMNMEETLSYFENDLFQACELDYGRGNFGMSVLLPKPDKSIDDIIEQLDEASWNSWVDSLDTLKVNLSLPKFTFDYEKKLNDILSLMGMGVAFNAQADFTGIRADGGLYIDYVKHMTFVEVNEEGTEAAAATVVAIVETSAGPDQTKYMTVNRPFLFVIREKTSNTIVFIGRVAEPVLEEN